MEVPCEFVYDQNTYKCVISDTDLSTVSTVSKFLGEHYHGLSNNEVNMISFRRSPMAAIPRGLTKIFPRLTLMEIYACDLRQIGKEDLRGFDNLAFLAVVVNKLRSLPGDLFELTPNLQFIDFSGNQITSVGSALFEPLKRIIEFTMRENSTVDVEYVEEFHPRRSAKKLRHFMRVIKEKCRAMESLRDIAGMKLSEGIDEANAVDVFVCGSQFAMEGLRRKAFGVIRKRIVPWIDEELMHQPRKVVEIVERRMVGRK